MQQGIKFDAEELHDSLIHASQGKISSGLFGVALACGLVHFDAQTGKYTWAAMAIMRVTGIATLILLARASAGWCTASREETGTDPSITMKSGARAYSKDVAAGTVQTDWHTETND